VYVGDINNDREVEFIAVDGNKITIYNKNTREIKHFYPYTSRYNGSIDMAVGDLTGDGRVEIVTGTSAGYGSHIRIFNDRGRLLSPGFFAYGKRFRGGVDVEICDTNGNGFGEIVTAPGIGGSNQIRTFSMKGRLLSPEIVVDRSVRDGLSLACGDFNGDGIDEFAGWSPELEEIRLLRSNGKRYAEPIPFKKQRDGRAALQVHDINRDGIDEFIWQQSTI
jgi:hypothetical protein